MNYTVRNDIGMCRLPCPALASALSHVDAARRVCGQKKGAAPVRLARVLRCGGVVPSYSSGDGDVDIQSITASVQ